MKMKTLALALAYLPFAVQASECVDAGITQEKYDLIGYSYRVDKVDGLFGCPGTLTASYLDVLGKARTVYAWESEHKRVNVTFVATSGMAAHMIDKSATGLDYVGSTPTPDEPAPVPGYPPGATFDFVGHVLRLPYMSHLDGATPTTLYNVQIVLSASGTWSLAHYETTPPVYPGTDVPLWDLSGVDYPVLNEAQSLLYVPQVVGGNSIVYRSLVLSLADDGWHLVSVNSIAPFPTPVPSGALTISALVNNYSGGQPGTVFSLSNGMALKLGAGCDFPPYTPPTITTTVTTTTDPETGLTTTETVTVETPAENQIPAVPVATLYRTIEPNAAVTYTLTLSGSPVSCAATVLVGQ